MCRCVRIPGDVNGYSTVHFTTNDSITIPSRRRYPLPFTPGFEYILQVARCYCTHAHTHTHTVSQCSAQYRRKVCVIVICVCVGVCAMCGCSSLDLTYTHTHSYTSV